MRKMTIRNMMFLSLSDNNNKMIFADFDAKRSQYIIYICSRSIDLPFNSLVYFIRFDLLYYVI